MKDKFPRPRREFVPLERLTFDARHQMRTGLIGKNGEPAVYSEEHVQTLLEAHSEGALFPPLECVFERTPKGKETYWVFSGFNRGEMWRRVPGVGSVEVNIHQGTFLTALRLALGENANHGLNRSPETCRRAFDTLFKNEELLKEVLAEANGEGGEGVTRALGAACKLSKGAIWKYLKDDGLHVNRRGVIERIPAGNVADPVEWRERPPMALNDSIPSKYIRKMEQSGVRNCGEIADRLLAGEELGLMPGALAAVEKQIELMSADDDKPIRFETQPEPEAKPSAANQNVAEPLIVTRRNCEPMPVLGGYTPSTAPPSPTESARAAEEVASVVLHRYRRIMDEAEECTQTLLQGPFRDHLLRHANNHGIPVTKADRLSDKMPIGEGASVETKFRWHVVQAIRATLADLAQTVVNATFKRVNED